MQRTVTSLILTLMLIVGWVLPFLASLFLLASLSYILIIEWPELAKKNRWLWLLAVFYIIIPFCICFILNLSAHRLILVAFIFLVASFDIGSYITGTLCGKHLLCPIISPNKTVEGSVGGFLVTQTVGLLLYQFLLKFFFSTLLYSVFTILLLSILALCGDLFESWLKRKAQVKDSGTLLPGHGGLLDRLDSYLWAIYVLPFIFK